MPTTTRARVLFPTLAVHVGLRPLRWMEGRVFQAPAFPSPPPLPAWPGHRRVPQSPPPAWQRFAARLVEVGPPPPVLAAAPPDTVAQLCEGALPAVQRGVANPITICRRGGGLFLEGRGQHRRGGGVPGRRGRVGPGDAFPGGRRNPTGAPPVALPRGWHVSWRLHRLRSQGPPPPCRPAARRRRQGGAPSRALHLPPQEWRGAGISVRLPHSVPLRPRPAAAGGRGPFSHGHGVETGSTGRPPGPFKRIVFGSE